MTRGVLSLLVFTGNYLVAQSDWQQEVRTTIACRLFPAHRLVLGIERLTYINHSPDTLRELHFHLYVNAFQRNSDMHRYQIRRYGRSVIDALPEALHGKNIVTSARLADGQSLPFRTSGTILTVPLTHNLLPDDSVTVELDFAVQVPALIRRMGWVSREGIEYTMAQWYPRICAYDEEGWHREPYLAREFYGEFGSFDVSITVPAPYVVGATGWPSGGSDALDRLNRILGFWSDQLKIQDSVQTRTYTYTASPVHDFAWGSDPQYLVREIDVDGTTVRLLHTAEVAGKWSRAGEFATKILHYMRDHVGAYPYPILTVAQGGDGGMEYPTLTFITGNRGEFSLASVMAHEIVHNWFQGMLANNELKDAWFDEGITSYYTTRIMEHVFGNYAMSEYEGDFQKKHFPKEDAFVKTITGYRQWAKGGFEEPATTHADSFATDESYSYGAYYKGQIFMNAMEYLLGRDTLDQCMREFFAEYRCRHVSLKTMRSFFERRLNSNLEWMFESWLRTTQTCDYELSSVSTSGPNVRVQVARRGDLRMPVDVYVRGRSGLTYGFRVPLHRTHPVPSGLRVLDEWDQNESSRAFLIPVDEPVSEVRIDTTQRLPETNRLNNSSYVPFDVHWQMPVRYPATIESYIIEHRPSIWYNRLDRLRIGWKSRGRYDEKDHALRAGVYYGVSSQKPDFELHYSTPVYSWGRQTMVYGNAYRLEGRRHVGTGVSKTIYGSTFRSSPIHDLSAEIQFDDLDEPGYLPIGSNWNSERTSRLVVTWKRSARSRWSVSAELPLPSTRSVFWKMTGEARIPLPGGGRHIKSSLRAFGGAAFGEIPIQDRFYVSGASPREQFASPFYRSRGTVPDRLWLNRGQRHWYMDGQGSLSGYHTANLQTTWLGAVNGEIATSNPFKSILKTSVLLLTESQPFLFADAAIFRRSFLQDAGVGLTYRIPLVPAWVGTYRVRAEFPFWVSHPDRNGPGESHWKLRWVVGLEGNR